MPTTHTSLLSVDDAAAYLRDKSGVTDITPKWVNGQIDHGKLGAVVVKRRRRVRQDQLDAMVQGWVREAA